MNRLLLILIVVCISSNLNAKMFDGNLEDAEFYTDDSCIKVNQLDSLGRKDGLWISRYGHTYFFKNGVLSSPCVTIDNRKDNQPYIASINHYENNNPHGSFVCFYPNGVVSDHIINLQPNTDFLCHPEYSLVEFAKVFPYQSYCYKFDENGKLIAEGWMIFGDDIEIDFIQVGKWKYYKADGNEEFVDYGYNLIETSIK